MYCGANGPVGFAVWADIGGRVLCFGGGVFDVTKRVVWYVLYTQQEGRVSAW